MLRLGWTHPTEGTGIAPLKPGGGTAVMEGVTALSGDDTGGWREVVEADLADSFAGVDKVLIHDWGVLAPGPSEAATHA